MHVITSENRKKAADTPNMKSKPQLYEALTPNEKDLN